MNHKAIGIAAAMVIAIGAPSARAATLVWDTFTEGDVNLAPWPGSNSTSSPITSPLVDTREVKAYGSFQVWSVTMESGALTYQRTVPLGTPPSRAACTLLYSNVRDGTFDILGYDAFVLDIGALTGRGELEVYGSPILPHRRFPIDDPGSLVILFSDLATSPLENMGIIGFIFRPLTEEFSVTIRGIDLVPESSVPVLAASGTLLLLLRRRRKR